MMNTKKYILILVLIIQVTGQRLCAQTYVSPGNVYGTWTLSGSPYEILGHILIPDDSTLTIEAGVTIEFQDYYKFFVNGRLLAIGAPADTIVFTVQPGAIATGWWGIRFDNTPATNDSSLIQFCKIEYGNASGSGNDRDGGAICMNNFSRLRVSNCLFENNNAAWSGGAIYCENYSSPVITYNTFRNNTATGSSGGGIYLYNYSSPFIGNNYFIGNGATSIGGAIGAYYPCSPTIKNNIVRNNVAGYYGGGLASINADVIIEGNTISDNMAGLSGGGVYCEGGTCLIKDNVVDSNSASGVQTNQGGGGIFYNNGSHTTTGNLIRNNTSSSYGGGIFSRSGFPIINNSIVNNTGASGGGIYLYNSVSPQIINCTIANNLAVDIGGGGLYCNSDCSPSLKNVILYGNFAGSGYGHQVYLVDNASDPSFLYCNVDNSTFSFYTNGNPYTGSYLNNINANPLFVSPSGGPGDFYDGCNSNWTLQATSPCVDSGSPDTTGLPLNDMAGNARICNGVVDMGAYENCMTTIPQLASYNAITIYPVPATGEITMVINAAYLQAHPEIHFTNSLGERLETFYINSSITTVQLDGFASGIYFYRFTTDNGIIAAGKLAVE